MRKKSKRLAFRAAAIVLVLFCLYLLFFPQKASNAVVSGLSLCYYTVIPAVFPYLVLSGLFVGLGFADRLGGVFSFLTERLFALPGCCATVIVMGIFCGFPVGGRMAMMLLKRGSITRKEAARLTAFCDFCGPPYIITVFGMHILKNVRLGFLVFLVQTVLALTAGIILGRGKRVLRQKSVCIETKPRFSTVTDSLSKSVSTTLDICGYVTFFAVLMSALSPLFQHLPASFGALLYGFFEMSGGISRLQSVNQPLVWGSVIIFWSGVSVFMQIASAVTGEKENSIPLGLYLLVRIIIVPVGGLLVYILARILNFI